MATPRQEDRRATLLGWIAGSRQVQGRLKIAALIGALVSLAARFEWATVSTVALVVVVGIFGIGMWITSSHIADWNTRLEALDRAERKAK